MNDELIVEALCDKCGCKVHVSTRDSWADIKCDDCKDDEKENRDECKYGRFGVDSLGIEVDCTIGYVCSRGQLDRYEPKETL